MAATAATRTVEQAGEAIRDLRKARKLTQKQLAARLDIRPAYMAQIETMTRTKRISHGLFLRICRELQANPDDLIREPTSDARAVA